MLKFRFWGHACVEFEYLGFKLMTDPWFGASFYGNNIVAYPPISPPSIEEAATINCLHISHIHPDHFSPESLKYFLRKTPVCIAKYPDSGLRDAIHRLGFKEIIEIDDDGVKIGPFKLFSAPLFPFDGSYDSLLIVETGKQRTLLNNDCELTYSDYLRIKEKFPEIDYGFLGYCQVTPYPICYKIQGVDYDAELMSEHEKSRRRLENLDSVFQFRHIFPYANGMRLIEKSSREKNTAFVDLAKLVKHVDPGFYLKFILLEPDSRWSEGVTSGGLKWKYDSDSVSQAFDQLGLNHEYVFSNTKPLDAVKYQNFFERFSEKINKGPGAAYSILFQILNPTGENVFSLFKKKSVVGEAEHDITSTNLQPDVRLELPLLWINEVIVGKLDMKQLYRSYQFIAYYNFTPSHKDQLIHRWS